MALVLEIEFLMGVCRAAREPGDDTPDWPPQPDRVFSALVSAWSARGELLDERKALEWLESQPPPATHASDHTARTTPDVFVPPNDFQTPRNDLDRQKWYRDYLVHGKRPPEEGGHERMWKRALSTFPEGRQRKERRFPVARPDDPMVALVWSAEPEPAVFDALNAIAGCVGYLGHSTSLVRCRFLFTEAASRHGTASPVRRRVYPGRLQELEEAHRANPARPTIRPGAPVVGRGSPAVTALGSDWLALEVVKGEVPDVRAAPLVCRVLRNALMSGYRKNGRGSAIPEEVSGHTANGEPTRRAHLAVAPLAFAGFPHADGRVLGFALIPPHGTRLDEIRGLRAAFEAVAHYVAEEERRVLTLQGPPLNAPLRLAPVASDGTARRSLGSAPYLRPSRFWATATPIVLERHLKGKGDAEIRGLVATACENAGLPRPDLRRIRAGKHSAVEGMPAARPLAGEPPWARWKVPKSLASRQLVHAVIDFGEVVGGPVLLGAGRFTGLGLCRRAGD